MIKCRAGHDYDEANTRWGTRANGKMYKQCRKCHARRQKLKYRNDDAYRERTQTRYRNRYRFGKTGGAENTAQPPHDLGPAV